MRKSASHGIAAFDSEQLDAVLRSVTINLSSSGSRNAFIFTYTHRRNIG